MSSEAIVYIVETDTSARENVCALLDIYDIPVRAFPDREEMLQALKATSSEPGGLMFCSDAHYVESVSMVQQLRDEGRTFPIIAAATHIEPGLRQQFMDAGATELVDKQLATDYISSRLADLQPGAAGSRNTPRSVLELPGGERVTFRVMRPQDAELEQEFTRSLSEQSRYRRFFSGIKELPPYMLERLTNIVFPISYAVIATIPEGDEERQIGVARYMPTGTPGTAEFAVVVADQWQGHGIARRLLQAIIAAAVTAGADRLEGLVLKENLPMLEFMQKMGFVEVPDGSPEPTALLFVKNFR